MKFFWAIFATTCLMTLVNGASKYTKDMNDKTKLKKKMMKEEEEINLKNERNPFRTKKMNMIWDKAIKHASPADLDSLRMDLKVLDKEQLKLKQVIADGLDEDGEMMAAQRDKLLDVLKKYGIYDEVTGSPKVKDMMNDELSKLGGGQQMDRMIQKKVDRLLKKAKEAGFTEEEISDLKVELGHHEQRMDEFRQLRGEVEEMMDRHENAIDPIPKTEQNKLRRDTERATKEKYAEVIDRFLEMERDINKKMNQDGTFTEQRVVTLWNYAKRAEFDEQELASLKEELRHYEVKLQKQRHFEEELASLNDVRKHNSRSGPPGDKIKSKYDEGDRKLKKYDDKLARQIAKKLGVHHSEL